MKKLSFFALAMVGLLFAACSSDKDVEEEAQAEFRSDGYMSLNINLPTAPITRAYNDVFDDGIEDEYKVTDCALLLFQGKDEASAKLINAQAIILPFDETDEDNKEGTDEKDNDNVTTSYQAIAKVKGYANKDGNNLYALAFINYRTLMEIDNKTDMPKIAGVALDKTATLSTLRNLKTNLNLTTKGGAYFFMTNAVMSSTPGGSTLPVAGNVYQLAKMDRSRIKETIEEAKKEPAGEIYVERAVAKATLEFKPGIKVMNDFDIDYDNNGVEWTIDNREPETFVVRNPGDLSYIAYKSGGRDNYRFVGSATTKGTTTLTMEDAYRTYWCIDPQYNKDAEGMLPVLDGNTLTPAPTWVPVGETPLYCYENTFDVDHQNYKNTTRAIIKVTLQDKTTFWTVNGQPAQYAKQEEATSYVTANIIIKSELIDAFKKAMKVTGKYSLTGEEFTTGYTRDNETGQLKLTTLELNTQKIDASVFDITKLTEEFASVKKDVMDAMNERVIVREYQKGQMWYEARFKHFAGAGLSDPSDLAPWNTKDTSWEGDVSGGTTDVAYPDGNGYTRDQNYLGRYGMVRNNWYYVIVDEFKNFGYPADPSGQVNNEDFDDPDTPDDNIVEYIAVRIHVLSWAKREQKWGF